ncbi:hypothetical protein THUN1379_24800 [Paludibacterium sp. THUN1379]|uniref:hypothetical protein n=1 Tax=Paludibacterium sp. THUN1379 TaxID=3112107 RepID=UPI00308B7E2F|nr:hypothetical protein THUN1379_24800 [Paludibacterium sp. THUN1379]
MTLTDEAKAWYFRICDGHLAPHEDPPAHIIAALTPPGAELIAKGLHWHESTLSVMQGYRQRLASQPD